MPLQRVCNGGPQHTPEPLQGRQQLIVQSETPAIQVPCCCSWYPPPPTPSHREAPPLIKMTAAGSWAAISAPKFSEVHGGGPADSKLHGSVAGGGQGPMGQQRAAVTGGRQRRGRR